MSCHLQDLWRGFLWREEGVVCGILVRRCAVRRVADEGRVGGTSQQACSVQFLGVNVIPRPAGGCATPGKVNLPAVLSCTRLILVSTPAASPCIPSTPCNASPCALTPAFHHPVTSPLSCLVLSHPVPSPVPRLVLLTLHLHLYHVLPHLYLLCISPRPFFPDVLGPGHLTPGPWQRRG
ncbi:hypothetical protein E2C01_069296 [Portunus trituberculatus]|uniref:Uncharacterized protein n=1 Tax=Portunus trituberculatus TaxID=210409 RepID=A0A5B7HYZ6_PORTR|nr:hypothetical protein [Portunus trituberculatus]